MLRYLCATTLLIATSALAAPADDAQQMIDDGLTFLADHQQDDGSWQGEDRVPPAITALALRGMIVKFGPDDPRVAKGIDALLAQQADDGGIYDNLLANYNTAISISALAAANKDGRYDEQLGKAVAYLRHLQWLPGAESEDATPKTGEKDEVADENDPFYGGWGYGGHPGRAGRPDLSNLQMSIQALKDAGIPPTDPAYQRALKFITRVQNNSETNPAEWAGDDGGFVYGPGSDKRGDSEAGDYTTPSGERRVRSYGSMTYAGFKSMLYAGLAKDDPRVAAAYDWIKNNWTLDENPGMGEASAKDRESGLYYYFLAMARGLNAYDEPMIDTANQGKVDWRVAFLKKASALQNDDGSWAGNARWREDDPVMVTAYMVIALQEVAEDLQQHPAE